MSLGPKKIIALLFLHPILITLYPLIRILIFGSGAATSLAEMLFGFLPDLYLYSLFCLSVINNKEKLFNKKLYTSVDFSVLVFFIINVIIGVVFISNLKAGYQAFRLTYLPVLAYFILWLNFEKKHLEWVYQLLHRIFLWYFLVAVIGLLLYFVFPDFENYLIQRSGGKHFAYFIRRMGSFIFNPVPLGTLLSVASLYYSHLLITKGNKKYYFISIILLVSLLLTISRGAIIAYIISALIYLLSTKFTKRSIWLLLIWIFTFSSFSFFVSNLEYINDLISGKNDVQINKGVAVGGKINMDKSGWMYNSTVKTAGMDSSVSRVKLWKKSFADFKARPFGYGFGNSGHIATQYFGKNSTTTNAAVSATDGWFIKLATETGILGLITYLLLCITIGIALIKKKGDLLKVNWLFFACFFILVNIQNVGSNVLDYFCFAPLFWIMICLFSLQLNFSENE
jgi:hypothetical protein